MSYGSARQMNETMAKESYGRGRDLTGIEDYDI